MKYTFYRPQEVNCEEFEQIVTKLEQDYLELLEGKVEEKELRSYLRKLIKDQKPLEKNPDMGFWGLDDPAEMPSDARVEFFYKPTYYATAIMIYSLLHYPEITKGLPALLFTLERAMLASTGRNFLGHGYDRFEGELEAMLVFAKASAHTYVEKNSYLCKCFTDLYLGNLKRYELMIKNNATILPNFPCDVDYGDQIHEIVDMVNGRAS